MYRARDRAGRGDGEEVGGDGWGEGCQLGGGGVGRMQADG